MSVSHNRSARLRSWAVALCTFASLLVSACGGGGGGDSGAAAAAPVADPSGVQAVKAATADGKAYVVVGASAVQQLEVTLEAGVAASEIDLTVQFGDRAELVAVSGRWQIAVTGAAAATEEKVVVIATRRATGGKRSFDLPLVTMVASHSASATVGVAGAQLQTASGQVVRLTMNAGAPAMTPPRVTLQQVQIPGGAELLTFSIDDAAAAEHVSVALPDLNSDMDLAIAKPARADGSARKLDLSSTPVPYAQNSDSLGVRWLTFKAWYLSAQRVSSGQPITVANFVASTRATVNGRRGTAFSVTLEEASHLDSTVAQFRADIAPAQPVLFIHGFTPGSKFGGGQGTWARFPVLARQAGYLPFEFQWRTDARFVDVAADLARTVQEISDRTGGARVHVVAHSFGGVLARTMLQGLAVNVPVARYATARSRVATLTTLGSPHSGVMDAAKTALSPDGQINMTLPGGQDAWTFEACGQVSCHVMGEPVFDGGRFVQYRAVLGIRNEPGEHAVALANSVQEMPNLRMSVGIGLRVVRSNGNFVFGPGDALISYAGQRLVPSDGTTTLRKQSAVGAATVTEVVLGIDRDVTPGMALTDTERTAPERAGGYLHSGSTGAVINEPVGDKSITVAGPPFMQGLDEISVAHQFGIEAAALRGCDQLATCHHAGWQLFLSQAGPMPCLQMAAGCTPTTTDPSVPTITGASLVPVSPPRLEVTFSQPMNPTHFTTGFYVPTSSVWETPTKFVITFSSYSPGGTITLKAPTAADTRGFRSAAGVALAADYVFQFPSNPPPTGTAPNVTNLNFVSAVPPRLEVTFDQPMKPTYGTTGNYVPSSSVWESTTKFVITFSSFTPGGAITLVAGNFVSAAGLPLAADVTYKFPFDSGALLARWTFDDCTGADSSGNDRNAIVNGGPACVTGRSGNALRFAGLDVLDNVAPQWLELPRNPGPALTFATWFKWEPTTGFRSSGLNESIWAIGDTQSDTNSTGIWISNAATRSLYAYGTNGPAATAVPGQWMHVAFTSDGKVSKLYVNGEYAHEVIHATPINFTGQAQFISSFERQGFPTLRHVFSGLIDDARLYNRVLTADEVRSVFLGN